MKKLLCTILCLCLIIPVMACAEPKTITAVASDVNPSALFSIAVDARIKAYNRADNTMTVEIIVPEAYDPDEVESLQVGDAIYTQGQAITVESVVNDYGVIILNQKNPDDPTDSIMLYQGADMNYEIMEADDHTWTTLGILNVPVSGSLLYLDEIDPATGETLGNPTVHNLQQFVAELEGGSEAGPGFDTNNTTVVFDETGALALIRRFYVPWQ